MEDEEAVDPITQEPFEHPVLASDGHVYEWESLSQHVQMSIASHRLPSSPLTREVLRPRVRRPDGSTAVLYSFPQQCVNLWLHVRLETIQDRCTGVEGLAHWFGTLFGGKMECRIGWVVDWQSFEQSKPHIVGPPDRCGRVIPGWRQWKQRIGQALGCASMFENPDLLLEGFVDAADMTLYDAVRITLSR